MYQPAQFTNLLPVLISTMSDRYGLGEWIASTSAISSAIWPSANRALYIPLYIDRPGIVTKFWTLNGTAVAGNIDIGLYQDFTAGNFGKIVSTGAVAASGTSAIQEFDVTDFAITQGVYFLGMSCSVGATVNFFGAQPNVVTYMSTFGVTQQATAHPLPATATPAVAVSGYIPVCGIAFRTLVA